MVDIENIKSGDIINTTYGKVEVVRTEKVADPLNFQTKTFVIVNYDGAERLMPNEFIKPRSRKPLPLGGGGIDRSRFFLKNICYLQI